MAPVLQRLAKNVVMVNDLTGHMAIKNKDATSKHAKIIHHSGTAEVHTSSECVQGCGKGITPSANAIGPCAACT